jgi:hypothetical protein
MGWDTSRRLRDALAARLPELVTFPSPPALARRADFWHEFARGGPMLLAIVACVDPDKLDGDLPSHGPGSSAWASEDVTCETDGDCLSGEVCGDGVCQPDRCTSGLSESEAPLGRSLLVQEHAELLVVEMAAYEGAYWVDGYQAGTSSTSYDYSWEVGSRKVTDVAGGRFHEDGPASWVAAIDGRSEMALDGATLDLDFEAVAVSAGDTDGDGVDEAIAVNGGDVAICAADGGSCAVWSFGNGVEHVDVAAGDLDGDMIDEVVSLIDVDGYRYLYAINVDAASTGQVEGWSGYVGDEQPIRIAVADVDGDRAAEIVGAVDGGWWGHPGCQGRGWRDLGHRAGYIRRL